MLRRLSLVALTLVLGASTAWAADSKDPLQRARTLYNDGQYDAAVTAADEARKTPGRADSADLIAARALLEKYRSNQSESDLASARERLRRIAADRFSAGERLEYVVGLGETLYFDDATGAAAQVFGSVLDSGADEPTNSAASLSAPARERVVDWWATALDRDARPRPDIERQGIYQRIRDRMAKELARDAGNAAALYWMAAAARSQGDLQGAWDAAQAAWAWAPLAGDRGPKLRTDLEELVNRAIIPERARMIGEPVESLTAAWDAFKAKWRP